MKIIFSAKGKDWQDLVDPRLGRAEGFVLYNEDDQNIEYISNENGMEASHGAGLQMAKTVLDLGTQVIITGNGPGEKAGAVFAKSNVDIYVGAGDMSLENAYKAYKNNELTKI